MSDGILATTRPKDATDRPTLADSDRILTDNATGAGSTAYGNLKAQLNAELNPAAVADNAAAAAASASAAAASAAAAATSETNAGNSATAAAASATTASTAATTATTKAGEAATSETNAATSAASALTQANNAAASATTAAGHATTATTKAGEAAGSATTASNAATTATTKAGEAATSQSNAATSAASALASANAAATSESNASGSASAAALSASEAGASAAAASTSETNAAASATAAAASAVTALNAIAQAFKGGVAGSAVPDTSALAGDTYRITAAGTSQSITWAIGDAAIYNGTSGSWTRLPGYYAGHEAISIYQTATRAVDGWLYNDGITAQRAYIEPVLARSNLAGVQEATYIWRGKIPATAPAANMYLEALNPNTTISNTNTAWSFFLTFSAGNSFNIEQNGTSSADKRRFTSIGFFAAYGDESRDNRFLEIRLTPTTFVCRLDGVDITSFFTAANTGTPPDWLPTSGNFVTRLSGNSFAAGSHPIGVWINRHLTDTESEVLRLTGRWPADCLAGGSMSFTSDPYLAVGASGYSTSNPSGGATVVSGRNTASPIYGAADYKMEITVAGVSAQYPRVSLSDKSLVLGQRYRLQIWYQRVTGTQTLARFYFSGSGSSPYVSLSNFDGSVQYHTAEFTCTANGGSATPPMMILDGTLTGEYRFVCDIIPVGLLSLPTVGPDRIVRDATKTAPSLPGYLVGITPQTRGGRNSIPFKITASGYLYADTQIIGGGRGIVGIIASGNGTFSLGDSAGSPATVLNAGTATASYAQFIPLKALTTGGKVYGTLGTATSVQGLLITDDLVSLT